MFTSISPKASERAIKTIRTILDRWFIFSSDEPTNSDKAKFWKAVLDLYRTPRSEIHKEWEAFRKPAVEAKKAKADEDMIAYLEHWKSTPLWGWGYCDPVVLKIDFMDDGILLRDDFGMYVAKEFKTWDMREEKICRTDEVVLHKSKTPKAFEWCKKNLAMRSYN